MTLRSVPWNEKENEEGYKKRKDESEPSKEDIDPKKAWKEEEYKPSSSIPLPLVEPPTGSSPYE